MNGHAQVQTSARLITSRRIIIRIISAEKLHLALIGYAENQLSNMREFQAPRAPAGALGAIKEFDFLEPIGSLYELDYQRKKEVKQAKFYIAEYEQEAKLPIKSLASSIKNSQ